MVSRSTNGFPQSASPKLRTSLPLAEPPKAREALIKKQASDQCSALGLELNRRLLFRHALGKYNGPYIKRQADEFSKGSSLQELRRGFVNKISYLCDVRKEGGTVTAAALQALKYGNFLWLAANEGITNDIKSFVQWILDQLRKLKSDNQQRIENAILKEAIERARPRMSFYQSKLVYYERKCRQHLLKIIDKNKSGLIT
jgi:hypothetical protein